MRAIDFLKEGGDVATGPSREDAIRWKPTDSEGRAWAVSPETWEAEAALKIKHFLNDKWLGIKDKFGIEITPEELEEWQSRNFVVDDTPKVIIDDNGVPQWNPEWRSITGDTAAEHTLAQQTKLDQAIADRRGELGLASDKEVDQQSFADDSATDAQNYATPRPGGPERLDPGKNQGIYYQYPGKGSNAGNRPERSGRTSRGGRE